MCMFGDVGPEVKVECLPQLLTDSARLVQLDSKLQGCTCLYRPHTGVTNMNHWAQILPEY